jgi:hypothetical protein
LTRLVRFEEPLMFQVVSAASVTFETLPGAV